MSTTNPESETINIEKDRGDNDYRSKTIPLFINRNYLLLFLGHSISTFGDVVFSLTLSLWVVLSVARGQSWAPLASGGVLLSMTIPILLFGSVAGVFVDRWEKRRTMLRMDGIRILLIALILPITGIIPLPWALPAIFKLIIIYVIVFSESTCSQFFNPSALILVGDIVPEEHRTRAIGFEQTISGLAYILGPPLATLLFFSLGVYLAVILNVISYAVSFLAISAIRLTPAFMTQSEKKTDSFRQEYIVGLRFIMRNRILLTIMISAFLAVIPEGAQNALGIFFYQSTLQAPLNFFGFIGAAAGIGSVLGALITALFVARLNIGYAFSIAVLFIGALMIVYARTHNLIVALICIFMTGLLVAAVNVMVGPLMLKVTPREMVGRVAATMISVLAIGSFLSIFILSFIASTILHNFHAVVLGVGFNTYDTIFALTGLFALLGGIYACYNMWKVRIPVASSQAENQE